MTSPSATRDRADLLQRFKTLSRERLESIKKSSQTVRTTAEDPATKKILMRELHTLKGEARLVNFPFLFEVVEAVERVLKSVDEFSEGVGIAEDFSLVDEGVHLMEQILSDTVNQAAYEAFLERCMTHLVVLSSRTRDRRSTSSTLSPIEIRGEGLMEPTPTIRDTQAVPILDADAMRETEQNAEAFSTALSVPQVIDSSSTKTLPIGELNHAIVRELREILTLDRARLGDPEIGPNARQSLEIVLTMQEQLGYHIHHLADRFERLKADLVAIVEDAQSLSQLSTGTNALATAQPNVEKMPASQPMKGHRVLVAEDSELTRDMIVASLTKQGFEVIQATNGKEALAKMTSEVALVFTDVEMPLMTGFELIAALRRSDVGKTVPIIVLSSRASLDDKKRASELGANAYIVKADFSEELIASAVSRFLSKGSA